MNVFIARFIAIMLLVIPGIAATYGFLSIKNALFHYFADFGNEEIIPTFQWGRFILGIILFLSGIGFIGGWIFFRDKKNNYLSSRFRKKNKR